jgi:hypothetical protein
MVERAWLPSMRQSTSMMAFMEKTLLPAWVPA